MSLRWYVVSGQFNYTKNRVFHAILLPVFIEFSRGIGTYSSAKFESEIIVQKEIMESDTCRHLYIIRLDLNKLTCTRREFYDAMAAENVQCQIHYVPVYWFPYYKHLGYERGLCPNAEEVYKGIMSIPLYPKMTDQDVEDVIHAVIKVVENYRK